MGFPRSAFPPLVMSGALTMEWLKVEDDTKGCTKFNDPIASILNVRTIHAVRHKKVRAIQHSHLSSSLTLSANSPRTDVCG